MASSKLFQPTKLGNLTLGHRVVFAPCTRVRADSKHVPGLLTAEYYSQRTSTPGTLAITEATYISPEGGGHPNVPGIYSDEQVAAWKKVTNAVHANGSYIFLQIWALGRSAQPENLSAEGPYPYVSASSVQLKGKNLPPQELTIPEIKRYVQQFAQAARRAVHEAEFDGVEIHGANGYLIDQFFQDVSNKRTDEYGGSVENRARFSLEIVEAISKTVGEEKVGFRISPWGTVQDMGMTNPKPTFGHFVTRLREQHPSLAYVHVVDPRVDGSSTREGGTPPGQSNDFVRDIWAPRPLISAGGYTRATAIEAVDAHNDLIAFGRAFIANPDLPMRLKDGIPLNISDRKTYYLNGDTTSRGYTDYPFASTSVLAHRRTLSHHRKGQLPIYTRFYSSRY